MSKNSKAYREAAEKIDRERLYTPLEAAKLAKETSSKKQDATVEVAIRLGVDPRKADQLVRGTVNLPHGTGKTARVIAFASGPKAAEAAFRKAAGLSPSFSACAGSSTATIRPIPWATTRRPTGATAGSSWSSSTPAPRTISKRSKATSSPAVRVSCS